MHLSAFRQVDVRRSSQLGLIVHFRNKIEGRVLVHLDNHGQVFLLFEHAFDDAANADFVAIMGHFAVRRDFDANGGLLLNFWRGRRQGANPDVAKTDWISVILENERPFGGGTGEVGGGGFFAGNRNVILDKNAVVKDGERAGNHAGSIFGRLGRDENNVVALPFAWFSGGVD